MVRHTYLPTYLPTVIPVVCITYLPTYLPTGLFGELILQLIDERPWLVLKDVLKP